MAVGAAANYLTDGDGIVLHHFAEVFSISLSFIYFEADDRQRRKKAKGRGDSYAASGIDISPQFDDWGGEHCRSACGYHVWLSRGCFLDVAGCLICYGN